MPANARNPNNGLRVMHVITGTHTGGAEMVLERLATELNHLGVDIIVCSLSSVGIVGERLRRRGITVVSLDMNSVPSTFAGFIRLIRQIRHYRPQIVQTWLYHADLLGGLAAKFSRGIPVIWSLRNSKLQLRPGKRIIVSACRMFSRWIPMRIVACAHSAKQSHIEIGYPSDRIQVIPNGCDVSVFTLNTGPKSPVRGSLGLDAQHQLFGLVGRHDIHKDQRGFLKAVALFFQANDAPWLHFVLCGEGMDAEDSVLKQYVASQGLTGRVHFLGRQEDMPAFYHALDVLVSSSVSEGFSNVIAEAMACGLPCIVTDVGDSSHIVGDTGVVVPAADPTALAEGFKTMAFMPRPERRVLGELARKRIEKEFNLYTMIKSYLSLYHQVAPQRGSTCAG